MYATLVVTEGPERGRVYSLTEGELIIGRDAACQVRLTDMKVSRRHTRVNVRNGTCELVDLGSSNGTWVNGGQIQTKPLEDGDLIGIGNTRLHFREPQKSATGPLLSPSETQRITLTSDGLLQWQDASDVDSLRRAKGDLETLYRLGRTINPILETSQLVPKLLDLIFEEVRKVDHCSVLLLDPDTARITATASRYGRVAPSADLPPFNASMVEQVVRAKKAILTFDGLGGGAQAQSAICAPILMQKTLLGIIYADTLVLEHRFTRDDLRLLAAIALQAGAALANAQLYERLVFEKNELTAAHHELKLAQDRLLQSEKLAAVGQLASGIVHDIKNPMTVIMGYLSIMREKLQGKQPEVMRQLELSDDLNSAEEGIRYCNEVINNLLRFAKPSSLTKAPLQLNDIVQDTVRFLTPELNKLQVATEVNCAADLPLIAADGNQLKQVFINIVLNAAQAMDKPSPLIRVVTEYAADETPPSVRIQITDNGKGMDESQRRRVFDPFFTTKTLTQGSGGSGLGLSISYAIINSHGGRIVVASTPGVGSSFTVILPAEGRSA